jgi:hypothetical protein
MIRILPTILILAMFATFSVPAQEPQRTLTNSDILNMTKSGLAEQTIVLIIQKSSTKFDTSPEAIIELKKAGASDAVLNAMLGVPASNPTPSTAAVTFTAKQDCGSSLDNVLGSLGPRQQLSEIRSLRLFGQTIVNRSSGTIAAQVERVTVYPSSIYMLVQQPSGVAAKTVLTPEFNYLISGKMTTSIPTETMQELVSGLKLDPIYVSQHRNQYVCESEGTEQVGNFKTSRVRIAGEGVEAHWNIDPGSWRVLRVTTRIGTSDQSTDLSDWRKRSVSTS